jgi:glycosyltransferase involved in cell wall biosynthesis
MSLHEKPTITVVIPNYNYGHWIEEAIDSVALDDYPKKKIIVVDDGSTDNSARKVFNLLNNTRQVESNSIIGISGIYKNIELTLIACNENRGPSAARNIGVKFGFEKTDVFSFLDSDDMHIQGKLKHTSDALLNGWGNIGAVYSDYINFDINTFIKYYQYKEPFCTERILEECIMPSNSLVPKYVFDKIGFFDESMRVAEDWDFWIRVSKFYIGYHVPKFLSLIRTGSYNSTNTVSKEVWISNWQKIREKILNVK